MMDPTFSTFTQPTYGAAAIFDTPNTEESFPEGFDEVGNAQMEMGHLEDIPLQEDLLWDTPLGWDTYSTSSSSRTWDSGWSNNCFHNQHNNVLFHQQSSGSSYSDVPLPSGFEDSMLGSFDTPAAPENPPLRDYPEYASSIMGSPRQMDLPSYFQPTTHAPQDISSSGGLPPINGNGYSDDRGPRAEVHSGTDVGTPTRSSAVATAAGDNPPLMCCGRSFCGRASFDRHRRHHCKTFPIGPKRFKCDPEVHCQKAFSRRCGLKKHLDGAGLSRAEADRVVRRKYGKWMHGRPI